MEKYLRKLEDISEEEKRLGNIASAANEAIIFSLKEIANLFDSLDLICREKCNMFGEPRSAEAKELIISDSLIILKKTEQANEQALESVQRLYSVAMELSVIQNECNTITYELSVKNGSNDLSEFEKHIVTQLMRAAEKSYKRIFECYKSTYDSGMFWNDLFDNSIRQSLHNIERSFNFENDGNQIAIPRVLDNIRKVTDIISNATNSKHCGKEARR